MPFYLAISQLVDYTHKIISFYSRFIRKIEQHNKLLRNYTQNIDTLEQVAGIRNVVQCHGEFFQNLSFILSNAVW